MNKIKISIMLAVCIAMAACSGGEPNNGGDKSKSLQITITEYEWKFGEVSGMGELYERYTYNSDNKLIKSESNYSKGQDAGRVPKYSTYTYDAQNHLAERSDYIYSILTNRCKYTTNAIDSIATMSEYMGDGTLSESWSYTYDSQRRLIQAKQTYDINKVAYIDDYSYDGNNVKVVSHMVDTGDLFGTTVYEYNSHKDLTKSIWTDGKTGKQYVEIYNEYSYGSNGKISKWTKHGSNGSSSLTYNDYTYNADGTIKRIHVSYSYKTDQSNLDYTYSKL